MRSAYILRKEKKREALGTWALLHFCVETLIKIRQICTRILNSPDIKALIHFKTGRDASLMSLVTDLTSGILSILWQLSSLSSFAGLLFFLLSVTESCLSAEEGFVHEIWGWCDFPVKPVDPIRKQRLFLQTLPHFYTVKPLQLQQHYYF